MRIKSLILLIPILWVAQTSTVLADYEKGKEAFNKEDYETALIEWQEGAKAGDPRSLNGLGVLYRNGLGGVEQNYEEAIRLYEQASELGFAKAQTNLGLMFWNGLGVAQDHEKAAQLFGLAVEQDYAAAQIYLGQLYVRGLGVEKDLNEAERLYRLAAEKGNLSGIISLGDLFYFGFNNASKAVHWYYQAAKQGNGTAQLKLAQMYGMGEGISNDLVLCLVWSELAKQNGTKGEEIKEYCKKSSTPEQLNEAQELITEWNQRQ
ncbi:MAG: sel1 repeat family protein [Proteobacteria bacterium]|nr:sel1 repeat family protein [Pseudomonadota bacterium]